MAFSGCKKPFSSSLRLCANILTLLHSISKLVARLDAKNINFAVIGGMAMALRGVQRATFDLDILLMLSDLPAAHAALEMEGYSRFYHSENVSHYENRNSVLARVDILHAFRGASLGMLKRAERVSLGATCHLPVLQIEDIIGLKIQALVNDRARALGDWSDIHRLIAHSAESKRLVHWDLISEYLSIFNLESKLEELKHLYEDHH